MSIPSRLKVIEALAAGRPNDLIGMAECEWLDFKKDPYHLESDRGKFELCKDVAALANSQGGLVVCGITTVKQGNLAQETAAKCAPFPQSRADIDRYIDTTNEYLRPRVNTQFRWYHHFEGGVESTNCYLVIEIDPIPEARRYMIVRRVLSDKDRFVDGLVIPVRHGDRTVYLPSEEVYQLVNEGVRAREFPNHAVGSATNSDQESDGTVEELEHLLDWEDKPALFWESTPSVPYSVVPGLHSADGVRGGLLNQDVLRSSGFNFEDRLGKIRVHEGGLFLNQGHRGLWVRPDGRVTAGAVATPDALCWGMESRQVPNRLNVYVLTEMTLEYFRLADNLIMPRVPGEWSHRVVVRRFDGDTPRLLGPGGSSFTNFLSDALPASVDSWIHKWRAFRDAERDAFEALHAIYTLFGVDVETNPDVENDRVPASRFRNSN